MFYEFFVSYLTLVINFLKDRGSEEQILRALTYQFKERSRARSAKRAAQRLLKADHAVLRFADRTLAIQGAISKRSAARRAVMGAQIKQD